MKTSQILAPATDAGNSTAFSVDYDNPTTVIVTGLAGVETATLQLTTDQATWTDATYIDGTTIEATATVNNFLIVGPGVYRIAKSATAGSVGVSIAQ